MLKLKKILFSDTVIMICLFLVAVTIRAIPEFIAGQWPIGYDTFNTYAVQLTGYHGPLISWLKTANILYFFFLPFRGAGFSPDMTIKICGSLLYGFLAISFYFWARYFLKFDRLKSFLCCLLLIFQLAALRLSWDLYRNELGLIFLFWALINLPKIENRKNLILVIVFSILVGFSNELVTVIFLIILFVYLISLIIRKKYQFALRTALPFVVIFAIFWVVTHSPGQTLYSSHIYFISNNDNQIWRYFYQYQKDLSYQDLFEIIKRLFWLLYRYLFFFALYGFWLLRKNIILTTITLWLLIGSFSSLIFAGTGIIVWDRWLIMLVFPLTIYATEGIFAIGQIINQRLKKWHQILRPVLITMGVIFWFGFIGLSVLWALPFLTRTYPDAKPPLVDLKLNSYFPRTMVHNSVGIWKIEDTLNCVDWLDKNVPTGAVVLVDNRYRGLMLTRFEMDNRYIISNSWSESWSEKGLEVAKEKGFTNIYLIWKNQKINPPGFDRLYASSDVAIYKAQSF